MYDILTTAAIVDELADSMPDGRIQRVGLRDSRTLAFEVYRDRRRHHLVVTIGDPEPAFFRSPDPFAIDPGLITPFGLLLRKYLRGATLVAIDQPPLERIVRLSIAKRFWPHNREDDALEDDADELDDESSPVIPELVFVYLHIELMGRRSNVILVDEHGVVMDSLKRVTPKMSRVRPIWPSARYELPPQREGVDPRSITLEQVELIVGDSPTSTNLAKSLVDQIRGMSPAMAAEAVWRASRMGAPTPGVLAKTVRSIVEPLEIGAWNPTLYRDGDGDLVGYAAVPFGSLAEKGEAEPVGSMSDAVAAWQRTDLQVAGRHDGRRNRLLVRIRERRGIVDGRIRSIEKQQASVREADRYRRWGEAIYAHLWEIEPGQRALTIEEETIPLDPLRAAKDVAAEYFETYRRMQRGTGEVEEHLDDARTEREYLDQLETLTQLASTFPEIESVLAEWEAYAGPEKGERSKTRKRQPDRLRPSTDAEGNLVYVGRTGPQNDRVTFDIAAPDDWWLHARGVPGAHVIVRGNGREPSEGALERAASVAAWYSKNRTSGKVEVDLARRRDVRKIKGAGPGMVTYRNERTVLVSPGDESGL
ncbi:MAG TPA: NFACT RNA binding domain-containing protein [Thermomicrobiales bacterium]|nr:NFACT RNA binding domain-containing protein [Thermomicrobiales bacterium]